MILLTMKHLKNTLERFYREFDFDGRLRHDPLEFPRRYSEPEDAETAGFISSCLSYGRVTLFRPVIEQILEPCGRHPAQFLSEFDPKSQGRIFRGIRYRFNREEDIICLLYLTGSVIRKWGSLRELFYSRFSIKEKDTGSAIQGFFEEFLSLDTSRVYGRNIKPKGLLHFFPLPAAGSACKRMNLFLRWMVRRRDIDLGLWKRIPPSRLTIPLDTHITRISRCLGLTERSDSCWKTAREITESLKKFDSRDPLKFDFALCHQGISGACRGRKFRGICADCILSGKRK
jgi:uncharacterized protein (TIGR02757 family)